MVRRTHLTILGAVTRLRFLLRPGWIALALVVAGFAWACLAVLAPWQLGKNTSTAERNDLIEAAATAPRVDVNAVTAPNGKLAPADEWRPVTVTGTYLTEYEVLIRLRSVDERPAYEVITPMRTLTGNSVLVNRGYVRPEVGTAAPPVPAPPEGVVTVNGRLRAEEDNSIGRPVLTGPGVPELYAIDSSDIGGLTGLSPTAGYVQLEADQPGGLGLIALPQLESGPFLSYGLQWIAFGLMAPLGLGYFAFAELRERRREREGSGVPDARRTPGDSASSAGKASTPASPPRDVDADLGTTDAALSEADAALGTTDAALGEALRAGVDLGGLVSKTARRESAARKNNSGSPDLGGGRPGRALPPRYRPRQR